MQISNKKLYTSFIGKMFFNLYDINFEQIADTEDKKEIISDIINETYTIQIKDIFYFTIQNIFSICIKNLISLFFNKKTQTIIANKKHIIVKSNYVIMQITTAEEQLFIDNLKLKYVKVINTEKIASDTFSYCFNLRKVYLDKTTKIIDSDAFSNCINLECIFIPKTIEKIEYNAFQNCINLKYVIFY